MRKSIIPILALCLVVLCSCRSSDTVTITGNYIELETEGSRNDYYVMDYLMMDCCKEWTRICELCRSFKGANKVEGIEFELYDSDAKKVRKKPMTIKVTPSEEFAAVPYDSMRVVNFRTLDWYDVEEEDGKMVFVTDTPGIYLLVKYGEGELGIINLECDGQCSTCSDEW